MNLRPSPESLKLILRQSVRWLLLLHLLPLAALLIKTSPWITGDSARYLALAESISSGHGFSLENNGLFEPEGWRMPGYPLFIAICRAVTGGNNWGIVVGQSILFLLSVWLVWKVTTRVFGELTGLLFLLLSAGYPFVAYSAGQISPEIPCVFLLSLAFFLLSRGSAGDVALAALLIALSAYFRPNLLPLNAALMLAILISDSRAYKRVLIVAIVLVTTVTPWAVRNYSQFNVLTPLPVIRSTGNSLLLATWQSRISARSLIEYGMKGNITPEMATSGMLEQVGNLNRQIGVPESTVFVSPEAYPTNESKLKADTLFTQAALSNIRSWPLTYLKSSAVNALRMWFSANLPGNIPPLIRFGLIAEGALILILGVAGAVQALLKANQTSKPVIYSCVAMLLYFSLTLCWLHTEARYTIPARLFLLMFAAYFISSIYSFLQSRLSR